jgi:hypothetical protein
MRTLTHAPGIVAWAEFPCRCGRRNAFLTPWTNPAISKYRPPEVVEQLSLHTLFFYKTDYKNALIN